MINVSSWYEREWKVATEITDEEAKWGIETYIALIVLVGVVIFLICT